ARSLGYVVLGLNEFYTSKRCPCCEQFVAQLDLRRFFCNGPCQTYHHRDVMAAENMFRVVQEYLQRQARPKYLQPKCQDQSYPWATISATFSSSPSSPGRATTPAARRKRASSSSTQDHREKVSRL
ncbi:hypothetical protein EC991_008260, partial [Linnemannia zychae]